MIWLEGNQMEEKFKTGKSLYNHEMIFEMLLKKYNSYFLKK